jgi:hypothetical protein
MSYYTSGIHSRTINPMSNSTNFRTEFKFPSSEGELYMTDVRLCNIGATGSAGSHNINSMCGLSSLIRNISLFDGNVCLDQVLNQDIYSSFKNGYNSTNNDSIDKNHQLFKNNLGMVTIGNNDGNVSSQMNLVNLVDNVLTTVEGTPKNWISLRSILAFLEESMYLPTKIFKDLRLVVEYSSNLVNIMPNTQPASISTLSPFLQVNQLINPQAQQMVMKSYNGVIYRPVEHSVVFIPSVTPTVGLPNLAQNLTFTINSFNGKTLNRLLMVKQPLRTTVSNKYGRLCSESMFQESTQIVVNGANLLPGNGLVTENQARAMLYDLYGDCVDIVGAGWLPDAGNAVNDAANVLGKRDYRAVMVENYIENFQLVFGRQGQHNAGGPAQNTFQSNGAVNLHLFGEINKVLAVNPDGTYSIRYV